MSAVACLAFAVFYGVSFVWRAAVHRRATGQSPRLPRFGAGWIGYTAVDVSLMLCFAGPLFESVGVLTPLALVSYTAIQAAGIGLYCAGFTVSLMAQRRMGVLWRAGVDPAERTQLIRDGPFGFVRNPFFAGWMGVAIGVTLMAPNVVTIAGLVILVAALEVIVRCVEEPYLLNAHRHEYLRYVEDVGRFCPRFGCVRRAARALPAHLATRLHHRGQTMPVDRGDQFGDL
jgi:protein-S-isoprenylcysteine O-methyltransferase Ste14